MTRPIPVRSVDLARSSEALADLGEAREVHVLVRYQGVPLCRLLMPVTQGCIPLDEIWCAADTTIAREEELVGKTAPDLEFVYPPTPPPVVALPATTAIVCTKDRPEDLRRCLTALAAAASDTVEVLVVDNAPSDDRTRAVVRDFPRVTYVLESRQGLNWARHTGACAARHPILLYLDDDVVVEPDWVDELRRPFADESVGAATGAVEPLELETEGQILAERFAGFYRGFRPRRFSVNGTSPAGAGAVGAGASMAVRRSIALELKLFECEMDGGTPTRSGGDHHAFYVILREGRAIEYTPRALSWHRHRRTVEEVERALYGYGSGSICAALRAWRDYRDWDIPLVMARWRLFPAMQEAWRAWRTGGQSRPMSLVRAEWRGFVEALANDRAARRREASYLPRSLPMSEQSGATTPLPIPQRDEVTRGISPAISVVIPTHNRCDALGFTLAALSAQSLDPREFEIIVVANGCEDGTCEYLAGLHPAHALKVVEQNPSRGAAAARNEGAKHARAPIILFLDDDMEASPGLLAAHLNAHDAANNPKLVVLGHFPMLPHPGAGALTKFARLWWAEGFAARARPEYRFTFKDFCTGNISIPSALFRELGGFDDAIGAHHDGEDYELGYRLFEVGGRIRYEARASSIHHSSLTLDGALRRAEREGRGHATMVQRHPALFREFDISRMSRLAGYTALQPIWRACWRWPWAPAAIAHGLRWLVRPLMRRECYTLLWIFYRPLRGYHYWKGVSETIDFSEWERVARAGEAELSPRKEIEIDVDRDWALLESRLDGQGVDALRVTYRGALLGRLPPEPGAEPFHAASARALIARRFGRMLFALRARPGLE